jgi:para-aminobenzoate synthetase
VPQVIEILGLSGSNGCTTLLESVSNPGRYTIIGIPAPDYLILSHTCGESIVRISRHGQAEEYNLGDFTIWRWLSRFMEERKAVGGNPNSPFWGGLIGYTTYEAGVQTLEVPLVRQHRSQPDIHFAFVDRTVVFDLKTKTAYIQTTLPNDEEWLNSAKALLLRAMDAASTPVPSPRLSQGVLFDAFAPPKAIMPDKAQYLDKIRRAKEYLAEGQSYELCVTAQTQVVLDTSLLSQSVQQRSGWELYKILRERNPAPHACYLSLEGVTMAGSSPERFLSWSRDGHCQLRPIKGTVRKTPDMTRERASALLNTPKEIAENLMIVDLIRHDLHGCTNGPVDVSSLFSVEEYESVYQLVSVIEGNIDFDNDLTGIDVLSRSLPPGSMTGAPKKRSVQLLQELEDEERQLYSGVCGYWCVGGAGDFAVTIRSAFRYESTTDGSDADARVDVWRIGAGGAITALSDPEEEWEEMLTKLRSTLKAFIDI